MLIEKTIPRDVAKNVAEMDHNMVRIVRKAHMLITEACDLGLVLSISSAFVSPLDRTRVFNSTVYPDREHQNHPSYQE